MVISVCPAQTNEHLLTVFSLLYNVLHGQPKVQFMIIEPIKQCNPISLIWTQPLYPFRRGMRVQLNLFFHELCVLVSNFDLYTCTPAVLNLNTHKTRRQMRLAVPSVHKDLLCVVTDSNNLDFRVLYLAGLSIMRFFKNSFSG